MEPLNDEKGDRESLSEGEELEEVEGHAGNGLNVKVNSWQLGA